MDLTDCVMYTIAHVAQDVAIFHTVAMASCGQQDNNIPAHAAELSATVLLSSRMAHGNAGLTKVQFVVPSLLLVEFRNPSMPTLSFNGCLDMVMYIVYSLQGCIGELCGAPTAKTAMIPTW